MAIHSQYVADFFVKVFLADFYEYYDFNGFGIDVTQIEFSYRAKEEIVFIVSVSLEFGDYTYVWDFDDDSNIVTIYVIRLIHTSTLTRDAGMFKLTVTVSNEMITITMSREYTVDTTVSFDDVDLEKLDEYLS